MTYFTLQGFERDFHGVILICLECNRELTSRQHIAADVAIGGHAVTDADALVTFDTGFYGTYFHELSVRPA